MTTIAEIEQNASLPGQFSQERVKQLGKVCWEALEQRGRLEDVKKKITERAKNSGISTEALTFDNNPALYTTAVASFVEKRLRPDLVAAGVVRKITDFRMKGLNSVKVPLRSALISAADLPDNGSISYDNGTYGSQTITLGWKYAANKISHELVQHSAVDLISEEIGEIGDALSRKIDSDIIAALDAAGVAATNSNEIFCGAGTEITFATFLQGIQKAGENYARPDAALMSWETFTTFVNLAEVRTALQNQAAASPDDLFRPMTSFMGQMILVSAQVGDDDFYLIDRQRTGYLIEGTPVQTFDGRVSGELNYEVIGAQAYGIAIVQPKAVTVIRENEAAA